jgi:hypothetical protein
MCIDIRRPEITKAASTVFKKADTTNRNTSVTWTTSVRFLAGAGNFLFATASRKAIGA